MHIQYWAAAALLLACRNHASAQTGAAAQTDAAAQIGAAAQTSGAEAAHARTEFHFTVDLPYATAAPLFGAWEERKWSPDWHPQFLYPNPPQDREGAVFRIDHSSSDHGPSHSAVWMTTVFDLAAGHVQHVYILNHILMTRIDIRIVRNGERKTDVSVTYEWTALDPAANAHVRALAGHGEATAREWRDALNSYGASLKM